MAKANEKQVAVRIHATRADVRALLPEDLHIDEAAMDDLCLWLCDDYELGEGFFEAVRASVQGWVADREEEQEVREAAEAKGSGQIAKSIS
jgi:hypothetical protein